MSISRRLGGLPLVSVILTIAATLATSLFTLPPLIDYWVSLSHAGSPVQALVLDWPRLGLLTLVPVMAVGLLSFVLLTGTEVDRWLYACVSTSVLSVLFTGLQLVRHGESMFVHSGIATQLVFQAEGWHGLGVLLALPLGILTSLLGVPRFAAAPGSRIAAWVLTCYWLFLTMLWLAVLLSWRDLQSA